MSVSNSEANGLLTGFRAYRDVLNLTEVVEAQHRLVEAFGDAITPLDPLNVPELRRIEIMTPAESEMMLGRFETEADRYDVREITEVEQLARLARRGWQVKQMLSGHKFGVLETELEDEPQLGSLQLDQIDQLYQIEADRTSIFKAYVGTSTLTMALPPRAVTYPFFTLNDPELADDIADVTYSKAINLPLGPLLFEPVT